MLRRILTPPTQNVIVKEGSFGLGAFTPKNLSLNEYLGGTSLALWNGSLPAISKHRRSESSVEYIAEAFPIIPQVRGYTRCVVGTLAPSNTEWHPLTSRYPHPHHACLPIQLDHRMERAQRKLNRHRKLNYMFSLSDQTRMVLDAATVGGPTRCLNDSTVATRLNASADSAYAPAAPQPHSPLPYS